MGADHLTRMAPEYTAVIRTDRADELVARMVRFLKAQTWPPRDILFVDSSGSHSCAAQLRALDARVLIYPNEPFNYSKAINLGVAATITEYVLIISSHVLLEGTHLIQDGLGAAARHRAELVYWCHPTSADPGKRERIVDREKFNGRNGLSNSCAFLPVATVQARGFREEVFSAEDQEWTSWYLERFNRGILRYEDPDIKYMNPNANTTKVINEELAIAYFTFRRDLWLDRIVQRICRALLAVLRRRPERAHMHWEIAKGLTAAWFRPPKRKSRYY